MKADHYALDQEHDIFKNFLAHYHRCHVIVESESAAVVHLGFYQYNREVAS